MEDTAKQSKFRLILRVHAYAKDLDIALVKNVLNLPGDGPLIVSYSDENEGHMSFDFDEAPPLKDIDEEEKWQRSAFKNAVFWLRATRVESFDAIRKAGLKADVAVAGYLGMVPQELIKEIVRLDLSLWIFP
jgi:hypothetical protein